MVLLFPVIPFLEVYNKSLCRPRELLIEILQEYPEEVEHIFIPSCVVLRRCAGCCNDEMLQCTPTASYNITMQVSIYDCVYVFALYGAFNVLFLLRWPATVALWVDTITFSSQTCNPVSKDQQRFWPCVAFYPSLDSRRKRLL